MVKLSKPSKMPCKTWSLEARKTCPGSIDPITKEPVPVCQGCYASYGFYKMPDPKRIRIDNRRDWQRSGWVEEMIEAINAQRPDKEGKRYFRWFDSGDVYHPDLAFKIYQIMKGTPKVKHWLPTRSYKIPKIRAMLEEMKLLRNVMVRYSSDSVSGEHEKIHGSVVIPDHDFKIKAKKCDAYERDGKCGDCRACWSKSVKLIAYSAHGVKMKTVVRENAA